MALCGIAVFLMLPVILMPLYAKGAGAVVLYLPEDSVLNGKVTPSTILTDMNIYVSCIWDRGLQLV